MAPVRRLLILGCSGAGKSTLAREIAASTGLPLLPLDQLYWQPGWVERGAAEFDARLEVELIPKLILGSDISIPPPAFAIGIASLNRPGSFLRGQIPRFFSQQE